MDKRFGLFNFMLDKATFFMYPENELSFSMVFTFKQINMAAPMITRSKSF